MAESSVLIPTVDVGRELPSTSNTKQPFVVVCFYRESPREERCYGNNHERKPIH